MCLLTKGNLAQYTTKNHHVRRYFKKIIWCEIVSILPRIQSYFQSVRLSTTVIAPWHIPLRSEVCAGWKNRHQTGTPFIFPVVCTYRRYCIRLWIESSLILCVQVLSGQALICGYIPQTGGRIVFDSQQMASLPRLPNGASAASSFVFLPPHRRPYPHECVGRGESDEQNTRCWRFLFVVPAYSSWFCAARWARRPGRVLNAHISQDSTVPTSEWDSICIHERGWFAFTVGWRGLFRQGGKSLLFYSSVKHVRTFTKQGSGNSVTTQFLSWLPAIARWGRNSTVRKTIEGLHRFRSQ